MLTRVTARVTRHVVRAGQTCTRSRMYSTHHQSASSKSYSKAMMMVGVIAVGGAVAYATHSTAFSEGSKVNSKQQVTFNKYASTTGPNGERLMTPEDFLKAITEDDSDETRGVLDEAKFRVLFRMADLNNNGTISFSEFVHFEDIINKPDAEYMLAFRIFDRDANGFISKEDFKKVAASSFVTESAIPFDFNCELMDLYFGRGKNELNYSQFTQLLKDLQQERIKQEFRYFDKNGTGYIPADKFVQILGGVKLRRIPDYVKDNLGAVADLNKGTTNEGHVSYAQFVACNDMLLHVPSYKRVLDSAIRANNKNGASKDDFLRAARSSTSIEITPLEVDIIWQFFDADKDGRITITDIEKIAPSLLHKPQQSTSTSTSTSSGPQGKTFAQAALESIENFGLGAVAGGIGATAVYPIDLVKTRMQNQRAVDPALRQYKNSWDCFRQVLRGEGFRGLYKGLGPQIVGVAPEKAIKLTVNDLLRGLFEDKSRGEIYFPLEVLAGGGAGASQVMFTNPLEIVKIRLQVAGKDHVSSLGIIKELGISGLYKGAGACLLRDIPFSAIYFPTYAKMKELLKDENGKLKAADLLLAGAVAGIPAASLVTPADVIKTRLQVKAKTGEQTYTGIRDCFWKILRQEGPKAFFKGCLARVFRSSPQFGVTLLSYELLQQFFAPHVTPRHPTNAPLTAKDVAAIRAPTTAVRVKEMEKKFGPISVTTDDRKQTEDKKEKN
eukprot:TRINITY_DN1971_c0_g1_i1.p1 TRINITY_DN1971_c0_g1~~TRINITY_DN1971_c0_g1_i1.p1  ORF type:complete len:725 (+),score=230.78 TRINITY_DN1971_c0_g1_i1:130-2304(+)